MPDTLAHDEGAERGRAEIPAILGVGAGVLAVGVSRWGVHAWLCPTGPALWSGRRLLQSPSASVADHGVVETSSWAHHMAMNEFPGPGQQPAGNPRRRTPRRERGEAIRKAQEEDKKRAREQEVPADGPVRVRIVWDAQMSSPVPGGWGRPNGIGSARW